MTKQQPDNLKANAQFVLGLGIGTLFTAASLTPGSSTFGDRYSIGVAVGGALIVIGILLRYKSNTQQIASARHSNLKELLKK